METKDIIGQIAETIFSKKGFDVRVLDLRNITSIADYFVICSADSDTQVKAIAEAVEDDLRDHGIKCWHSEGFKGLNWVLLDYSDIVIHVFKQDSRNYYNLEKLWGDAPTEILEDKKLN